MRQHTVHINALSNGIVSFVTQLPVPQFRLADENQRHGTLRIEAAVEQEAELLQRFLLQQMCFVQDTDQLLLLYAVNEGNFLGVDEDGMQRNNGELDDILMILWGRSGVAQRQHIKQMKEEYERGM